MPKQKSKKTERQVESVEIVKQKCQDCQAEYDARKTTFDNGDITISPPRCEPCQIAHLTSVRVDAITEKMKLLGNLKPRISASYGNDGLSAVLANIQLAYENLLDRFSNAPQATTKKFDLRKIVK